MQRILPFESQPATRQDNLTRRTNVLDQLKPTPVFDTYWRFAAERQEIFFRRGAMSPPPWTDDPILCKYRFTNVYRAADRVSQYLIKHVIYTGDQSAREIFFRTLLFKFFNKIETWELLVRHLGLPASTEFSVERYNQILSREINSGGRIYSAAYIMPSGPTSHQSQRKHTFHLSLLSQMLRDNLPEQIVDAKTLQGTYNILLAYRGLGPFLSYQYTIDLNYSPMLDADEMEFVVPGPGALDGIAKCFSASLGVDRSDVIRMVTEHQGEEFERLGLNFRSLWGRPLHLIDCQNIFCEISKYARVRHPEFAGVSNRTRIKQKYHPASTPASCWFPPKWGINQLIEQRSFAP